jgi:hypothetical protein
MVIALNLCISYGSQNEIVTFALYIINRLGFITRWRVFNAWYGLSPYITLILFVLGGLKPGHK